jgi:ankyrin repeat protein
MIFENVTKFQKVGKSWLQVFKKCNTKTIIDLRIAVEHFYKELEITLDTRNCIYINPFINLLSLLSNNRQLDLSPLHIVAGYGQLTLFNEILQNVENKFPLDGLDRSTLHIAAMNDHLNIYESIVAIHGNISPHSTIDLNRMPINSTPLDTAANHNSLNVCRFIVENNPGKIALDNTSSWWHGWTPLHTAAFKGHSEIYKIIMEVVADKNPVVQGFSPLHLAAIEGKLEMCRLILENVNDKNPVDNNGKTPKDIAKEYNELEIVKLFS